MTGGLPGGPGEYAPRPRPLLSWGAMIDPIARVHPTADLEADVSVGPGTSIWHRAQVRTRRPDRRRRASSAATCSSTRASSSATGSRSRTRALVYHGVTVGGRRLHRARRDPDQRPATRARSPPTATWPGPTTGPSARSASRDGCSIGAGAVVVAGGDVGRVRDGRRRAPSSPATCPTTRSSSATRPAGIGWVCACGAAPRRLDGAARPPGADRRRAELACAACGRRYATTPTPTRCERAAPVAREPPHDPDRPAGHRAGRGDRGRHRGPPVRDARRGQAGRRARGARGPRSAASGTRSRISNGTRRPDGDLRGPRARPGRRGHHRRPHLQRDRQRRSCRPAPRRSSSTSSPTPTASTPTRIEAAITPRTRAIMPGPPVRPAGRHGRDRGDRRPPRPARSSRTPARPTAPTFRGRRVGSFGPARSACTRTKNMTTGEGGFITTDDDRLADWLRLYRNQGMRERYHHEMLGYNFRLTDLAAAIGLVQLDKLDAQHGPPAGDRRRATTRAFADLPIGRRSTPDGRTHVFHQYTIDVGGRARRDRRRPGASAGSAPASTTRSRSTASRTSWSAGLRRRPAGDRPAAARDPVAADVPRPRPTRSRRRSSPAVRDAVRERHGREPASTTAAMTGRLVARRRARRFASASIGPRARWAATTCASSRRATGCRPRGGRRPGPGSALAAAVRATGAPGFAEPLAMIAEADLDAVVIAAPTTSHVGAGPGRHRARASPVLVEKPLAATVDGGDRASSPRPARAGVPVQVGHVERFNPAVLELGRLLEAGWLSTRLRHHEPPGRAVPGAHPRRRRDRRPRHPRRRHPVVDRRRAADPRVYAETAQRIHADHEDLLFGLLSLPVGHGRACSTSTG